MKKCGTQNITHILHIAIVIASCIVAIVTVAAFLVVFFHAMSPLFSTNTSPHQVTSPTQATQPAQVPPQTSTIRTVPRTIAAFSFFTAIHWSEFSVLFRTLIYTLRIAICSTAIAFVVGMAAAFFISQRKFPFRKLLLAFAAVPLAVPALIVALGYVSIFGINGIINRTLMQIFHLQNAPLTFLYSPTGVIIAQGFYNFPIVALIVTARWEKLSPSMYEAARILGANRRRIFFCITLPDLLPSISAALIPVFLYCFSSFLIVLLFGGTATTLEVEIYRAAHSTLDFRRAAALSAIETFFSLVIIFVYSRLSAKNTYNKGAFFFNTNYETPKIGKARFQSKFDSAIEILSFALLMFLILIFFVAPFAGIFIGSIKNSSTNNTFSDNIFSSFAFSFTLIAKSVKNIFMSRGFQNALIGTLQTSPFTATFSCITAFVFAAILRTRDAEGKNTLLQTLPFLPMAVSSVVLGFGIMQVFTVKTFFTLILAETMLTWPLAFRQIHSALLHIPESAVEAAKLMSPHRTDLFFRIYLASEKRTVISAFGLCFAVSIGDTTLPLLISVPRFDTLALYTYRLASSYRFSAACLCGSILFFLCVIIFSATRQINSD